VKGFVFEGCFTQRCLISFYFGKLDVRGKPLQTMKAQSLEFTDFKPRHLSEFRNEKSYRGLQIGLWKKAQHNETLRDLSFCIALCYFTTLSN
jgi:hypothetical protein